MTIHESRRPFVLGLIGLVVTASLQLGFIIWGAARIATTVEGLQKTLAQIEQNMHDIGSELVGIKVEHATQQIQIKSLQDELTDLEKSEVKKR